MKKIKKLALGAIIMGLGYMVFANPESNTKKATQGLIEDGVVDSLDTGIEDGKGFGSIGFGSYNSGSKDFNITAGAWKDDIWTGIYYRNSNYGTDTLTQEYNKDYTTVSNEVTSVDTTKTFKNNGTLNFINDLSYNRFNKNSNKGFEFFVKTNFSNTNNTITKTVTDKESDATSSVNLTSSNLNLFRNGINLGVNFNGYKTEEKGEKNSYFALNSVSLSVNDNYSYKKAKNTTKKYNSTVGEGEQTLKHNVFNVTSRDEGFTFQGEYGYKLKDFGLMSTNYKLINSFSAAYTGPSATTTKKTVETTNTTEKTEKTKSSTISGIDLKLSDTVTPTWDFDINVGENVKVAARIDVPTTVTYSRDGAGYKATTTTTVVKDLEHSTQEKTVAKTQDVNSKVNINNYTLKTSPEVKAGLIWSVKPGKLNINLGATANAGTYTCSVKTENATKKVLKNKTVHTDEFGVKTVTEDSKAAVNTPADHENDTITESFSAAKYSVSASLGTTIFVNDKVSLDFLIDSGNTNGFSIGSFLTDTTASINFNVKF